MCGKRSSAGPVQTHKKPNLFCAIQTKLPRGFCRFVYILTKECAIEKSIEDTFQVFKDMFLQKIPLHRPPPEDIHFCYAHRPREVHSEAAGQPVRTVGAAGDRGSPIQFFDSLPFPGGSPDSPEFRLPCKNRRNDRAFFTYSDFPQCQHPMKYCRAI